MLTSPASPSPTRVATPSWLDTRLVLGVLLVLVSVVVGARVLAAADASQRVWVASRDLAAGSTLGDGDLERAKVRLFDNGPRYLVAADAAPLGYVLRRGVGAHELVPRESLARPDELSTGMREVSVPVPAGHLPDDLHAGQQVDVYLTASVPSSAPDAAAAPTTPAPASPATPATNEPSGPTRLVLSHVPVSLRPQAASLSAGTAPSVVLSVTSSDAPTLVAALQAGTIDLVRVPRSAELPALPVLQAAR